jgi:hypothetical protein
MSPCGDGDDHRDGDNRGDENLAKSLGEQIEWLGLGFSRRWVRTSELGAHAAGRDHEGGARAKARDFSGGSGGSGGAAAAVERRGRGGGCGRAAEALRRPGVHSRARTARHSAAASRGARRRWHGGSARRTRSRQLGGQAALGIRRERVVADEKEDGSRSKRTVKKGEIRFSRDDRTQWLNDRTRWRQRPVAFQ